MEREYVECTIDDLKLLKEVLSKNNNELINILTKIGKEYDNMPEVLDVPNASKVISKFPKIIKEYYYLVDEKRKYFDIVLDTAIKEYSQFMDDVSKTIGG